MKYFALILLALVMTGCAFSDATLDVGHDPEVIQPGPIAEAPSTTFVLGTLIDLREDQERVGYKKNSFGMNTADITTEKPVTEVIMEAVAHAFESNGHTVGDTGIAISGSVSQFWVDVDMNFWSLEVLGNTEATLIFTNMESGEVLYERIYKGSYSDKVQMASDKAYKAAMSGSVSSLIDEVVFDEDLSDALSNQ